MKAWRLRPPRKNLTQCPGSVDHYILRGLGGNDTIRGGNSEDFLFGDEGADRLSGGSSGDQFYFNAAQESYRTATVSFSDIITDFTDEGGGHDLLAVFPMGFYAIGDGHAGRLKIDYNPGLDRTYIRDLDGDGQSHFFQVVLSGNHAETLTRQNFSFADGTPLPDIGLIGVAEHSAEGALL